MSFIFPRKVIRSQGVISVAEHSKVQLKTYILIEHIKVENLNWQEAVQGGAFLLAKIFFLKFRKFPVSKGKTFSMQAKNLRSHW